MVAKSGQTNWNNAKPSYSKGNDIARNWRNWRNNSHSNNNSNWLNNEYTQQKNGISPNMNNQIFTPNPLQNKHIPMYNNNSTTNHPYVNNTTPFNVNSQQRPISNNGRYTPYNQRPQYTRFGNGNNTNDRTYMRDKNQQQNRENRGDRKPGVCNFCNKPGHWWKECRNRLSKDRQENQVTNIAQVNDTSTLDKKETKVNEYNDQIQNILHSLNRVKLTNKSDGKNHQPQISAITCGNANLDLFKNMQRVTRTANPVGANGQKLGYIGETIINLKIGDMTVENVRVALLKDISHKLILGNNLLLQLGINIQQGGQKMDIGTEKDIPVMGVNGVI